MPDIATKITLIAGTNRPGSNTRRVTSIVQALYTELGHPVTLLDLADLPPEIFDPSCYETKPASFSAFSDVVAETQGFHFVFPEYNGSIPGVLKYFIDMLELPESFTGRTAAFTGLAAGQWGGLRGSEHLQNLFTYLKGHVYPGRVFIPSVDDIFSEADGQLSDDKIKKRLRQQVAGFVEYTANLTRSQ